MDGMTQRLDRYGNFVLVASPASIEAIDSFAHELLSQGRNAATVVDAAAQDPDCALLQAYAACLFLFLQTREGYRRAAPYVTAAQKAQGGERERAFVAAVVDWWRGDETRALEKFQAIAERWPRDIVTLKITQILQINRGDAQGMRTVMTRAIRSTEDVGYAWGLLSFALIECGETLAAEHAGRRAVEISLDDPWAHHAVAHVLATSGRVAEGLAWMQGLSSTWDRCSSFIYTHNWWHTALLLLDLGDHAAALDLYDNRVWGYRKGHVQDQVNAVSLLARLELAGIDVGDRWADVGTHVAARIGDTVNSFLDLHAWYGLVRAGDSAGVTAFLDAMEACACSDRVDSAVWQTVTLPIARGMRAFAAGDFATTLNHMNGVRDLVYRVGGSAVQREWFEMIALSAELELQGEDGRLFHARMMKMLDEAHERNLHRPDAEPVSAHAGAW